MLAWLPCLALALSAHPGGQPGSSPVRPASLLRAADPVPPETVIEALKLKIKDLDQQKVKLFDAAALTQVELDRLKDQVAKENDRLGALLKDIAALNDLLKSGDAKLTFKGQSHTRDEVQKLLSADLDDYLAGQKVSDARKELLDARTKASEQVLAQLQAFEAARAALTVRLDTMRATLQGLRLRAADAGTKVDDKELAKVTADLDEITKKIDALNKTLELKDAPKPDAPKEK